MIFFNLYSLYLFSFFWWQQRIHDKWSILLIIYDEKSLVKNGLAYLLLAMKKSPMRNGLAYLSLVIKKVR